MATSTPRSPARTSEPLVPGVAADGTLPLPWLAAPLQAAHRLQRSHALLLQGAAGVGHLEFALLLAQTQLCESPRTLDDGRTPLACGRCASCHLVATRVHPDLLLLLPEAWRVRLGWLGEDEGRLAKGEAKPSKDLKVDQVRQGIAWTQQTSGRGRGKCLVLHPADALNTPAANALLKTLEEPPAGQRLILTTTDAEQLLPTVRSRCQKLVLPLPAPHDARAWLEARGLAQPEALLAATGGSPLEALVWAEEGLDGTLLAALPQQLARGDGSALAGRALPRVLDLLLKFAHDAAARAVGGAPRFFADANWPAGAPALPALLDWQRTLMRTARHDEHPWNAPLLLESLVEQGAACWPRGPARGGAARGGAAGRASLHSGA
ncbi:MAG: polymerase delta subunit HolB [Pseudomonadota bacterium]|jgi:DNA polymerase-3 subunit delta'